MSSGSSGSWAGRLELVSTIGSNAGTLSIVPPQVLLREGFVPSGSE